MLQEYAQQINDLLGGQSFWKNFNLLRSFIHQFEYQFPEEYGLFSIESANALAPLAGWGAGELDYGQKLFDFDSLSDEEKLKATKLISSIANMENRISFLPELEKKSEDLNLQNVDFSEVMSLIEAIPLAINLAQLIQEELFQREDVLFLLKNQKHILPH